MDLGIEGRVALVVGRLPRAGSGHGRGAGRRGGAGDALVAERRVAGRHGQASLRAAGADVAVDAADIADPGAPARLVEATVQAFGTIDIVIANAGGPPAAHALDVDDPMIDRALEANLKSAVRLVREAVPVMRGNGWGRICCITSYSVVQPMPGLALSNMARAGLWAWAKTAAQDLAAEGSGITLNLLCPGPHATDRMRELGGERG